MRDTDNAATWSKLGECIFKPGSNNQSEIQTMGPAAARCMRECLFKPGSNDQWMKRDTETMRRTAARCENVSLNQEVVADVRERCRQCGELEQGVLNVSLSQCPMGEEIEIQTIQRAAARCVNVSLSQERRPIDTDTATNCIMQLPMDE